LSGHSFVRICAAGPVAGGGRRPMLLTLMKAKLHRATVTLLDDGDVIEQAA
jgi:hypothetical protein